MTDLPCLLSRFAPSVGLYSSVFPLCWLYTSRLCTVCAALANYASSQGLVTLDGFLTAVASLQPSGYLTTAAKVVRSVLLAVYPCVCVSAAPFLCQDYVEVASGVTVLCGDHHDAKAEATFALYGVCPLANVCFDALSSTSIIILFRLCNMRRLQRRRRDLQGGGTEPLLFRLDVVVRLSYCGPLLTRWRVTCVRFIQ